VYIGFGWGSVRERVLLEDLWVDKPTVLKSGSLNLLEPSGPVQDCNGIALPNMFMRCVASCMTYTAPIASINLP
jgi:hypothetical protein